MVTTAILCTTPEFWEREVIYNLDPVTNLTTPSIAMTSFGQQDSYAIGYYWFLVLTFTLLPLLLLCVFNGILISTIVKAAASRLSMIPATSKTSSRGSNSHSAGDQNKVL